MLFETWDDVKSFIRLCLQLTAIGAAMFGVGAVLVLILVVMVNAVAQPAPPAQPPAMNAPLLEIVRYCEPLARERKTRTVVMPIMVGKIITMQPRTQVDYIDAPDQFITCMQGYEYSVKR
jgi:hypothetical protein